MDTSTDAQREVRLMMTSKPRSGSAAARPVDPCARARPGLAPPLGAHLATSRHGYAHHGVYVGGGTVIHYAGLCRAWHPGPVEETSLSRFALGRRVRIVDHADPKYSPAEVVERARSRLGEDHYNLLTNNCEHFCHWCIRGRSSSAQVLKRMAIPSLALSLATILAFSLPRLLA